MKKLSLLITVLMLSMAFAIAPAPLQQPPAENMALQNALQNGTDPAGATNQVRHDSLGGEDLGVRHDAVAPGADGVRHNSSMQGENMALQNALQNSAAGGQMESRQFRFAQAGGSMTEGVSNALKIRPGNNVLAGAVRAEGLSALPGGSMAGTEDLSALPGGSMAAGPATVRPGDQIRMNVQNTEVAIIPGEDNVVIRDGNLDVSTTELDIENGRPMFGGRELKAPPSMIQRNLGGRQIREMSLAEGEDGGGVYRVRHDSSFRLFGVFDMEAEVVGDYNIETGARVSQQNPWWSFLASENMNMEF